MRPLHHRDPGVVAAALTPSAAFAAVIPDGIHVHPQVLALIYRARGAAGMVLTTDKVATDPGAGTAFQRRQQRPNGGTQLRRPARGKPDHDDGRDQADGDGSGCERGRGCADGRDQSGESWVAQRGKIDLGCRADLIVLDRELNLKAVFIGGCELD